MVRAYALEAKRALAAVHSASRAALSLQRDIARTKAAYQKEDATSTISGSSFSPVTAADVMVQVLILSSLSQAFPADRFIAEETGAEMLAAGEGTRSAVLAAVAAHSPTPINEMDAIAALDLGRTGLDDGWSSKGGRTWVLDPVDGTKGFLRGDQFAVALSLLDGGEPVLGLLGCPNLGDEGALFWAEKGHGASWGTTHGEGSGLLFSGDGDGLDASAIQNACKPLRVSTPATGSELIRCEAFEAKHTNWAVSDAIGTRLGITQPPVRIDGQGKYGLLARGEAHVFTRLPARSYKEKIWDVCAGALILEEAGGKVTDTKGLPLDFSKGETLPDSVDGIVASNGQVHEALLEALAAVEGDGGGSS